MVLPPRRTSGLAIGSLVCAIFGWGPGSIVAVILGHVALRQIRRDPLRVRGKSVAKAGIVIGWVGIVALTIVIWLGIHFRKMFEEEPQRPQTREVNLTTAESLPMNNLPLFLMRTEDSSLRSGCYVLDRDKHSER